MAKLGVACPDYESYQVFSPLLNKVVESYHRGYNVSETQPRDLDPSHLNAGNPDPKGRYINSTRIRVARNLRGYGLACGGMTPESRREVEAKVIEALNSMPGDLAGTYYSLGGMDDATRKRMEEDHFLFRKEEG